MASRRTSYRASATSSGGRRKAHGRLDQHARRRRTEGARAIDQDADNTKDAVPPMNHFVLVTVRRLPDIYLRLSV